MSSHDRRELVQFLNDLAIDMAERLAAESSRYEQRERLLRGTLERQQDEIRLLKKTLENEKERSESL